MIDNRTIECFNFTQEEYDRYQSGEEVWRELTEWPDYKISTGGNILSFKHKKKYGKLGKPRKTHNGYRNIQVYYGDGIFLTKMMHVLVGITFLKNPDNLPEINHMNFVKHCNELWNLEWISKLNNARHARDNGRYNSYWKGKIAEQSPFSKRLFQYDLQGNLIKIYGGVREACRQNGFIRTRLAACYEGRWESAYDSIWKLEENV
jgi:hypothetical protein